MSIKPSSTDFSQEELRQLDKRPALYWILIIAGIGINWFGGFIRFHARYSPFSRKVLLEALLFVVLSGGISAAIGRKNWRYSLLAFFYVSLGVTGFFFIGSPS